MSVFENFKIDKMIVHEIFSKDENGNIPLPIYSNDTFLLEQLAMQKFKDRIINSIGNNSHSVKMNVVRTDDNSIFRTITPLFSSTDSKGFVEISQKVTNNLSLASTNRKIPGGAVVMFSGTTGNLNKKYICIAKAEKNEGFILEKNSQKNYFKFLTDLLFTASQKFYKIAILIDKKEDILPYKANDIDIYIYDSNIKLSQTKDVADYFYDKFMGCTFEEQSDILTLNFYNQTQKFINLSSLSYEDKIDATTALYAYLKVDNSSVISVQEYADNYIKEPKIKDEYITYMYKNEISANSFYKNLDKLKRKLENRKIKFTSNISISVPTDDFDNNFKIIERNDEYTTIKVKGAIEAQN